MGILIQEKAINQQPSVSEAVVKPQFDALTSLRFFAAALILFFHSAPFFFDTSFMKTWQLDQGVTFFFVLSGFILTYVYPKLDNKHAVKQFLLARLGRIWPTHLLMTCLALFLLPNSCSKPAVLWTHLFLVQSWVPRAEYYFGLNAVAWSISVEAFFYLCFIWLIKPWKFGWAGKVILGLILVTGSCFLSHFFSSSLSHSYLQFNQNFLLIINPLARLFEFILGMLTAKLSIRFSHRIDLGAWQMTIIEVILVAAIMTQITSINGFLAAISFPQHYPAFSQWLTYGGSSPLFALLIFFIATKRGYIAQILIHPILVWLGEISYSTYMLHLLLLHCLSFYMPEFARWGAWLNYSIYLALVISLSHLNFTFIENPCRRLVKAFSTSSNSHPFSLYNIPSLFTTNLRTIVIALLFPIVFIVAAAVHFVILQSRFQFAKINIDKNICFEDKFLLENVRMANASDGSKIQLTWRSLVPQILNRTVAINFVDVSKNMLAQAEYKDIFPRSVHAGQLWSETIYVPSNKARRQKWADLGLRVCAHDLHYLIPNRGQTDWWNTRLLIPLDKDTL